MPLFKRKSPHPGKATGQPSSNEHWATLQTLAIRYLALPPPPAPPAKDAEREKLRADIMKALVGSWVKVVAEDLSAGLGQQIGADDELGAELVRRDGSLEKLLRVEAERQARDTSPGLIDFHGGPTNLAAEAQQALLIARTARYHRQGQSLLTGLLNQWEPERGSLYTFASRIAANFLIDMWRQLDARGLLSSEQACYAEGDDDGEREAAEALLPDDAPSAEQLMEDKQRLAALHAAVDELPFKLRPLFQAWLSKDRHELSDTELANQMGVARGTFLTMQKSFFRTLRASLGDQAAPVARAE